MKTLAQVFAPFLLALAGASLLLAFAGSFVLVPGIESSHASSAMKLLQQGTDYFSTHYQPPLTTLLNAAGLSWFQANEFGLRIPMLFCHIVMLLSLYVIGNRHFGHVTGFWWIACLLACPLVMGLLKTSEPGLLSGWMLLLALYRFARCAADSRKTLHCMLAAIYTGLASLAGGLICLLAVYAVVLFYVVLNRFRRLAGMSDVLLFITLSGLLAAGVPLFLWLGGYTFHAGQWLAVQLGHWQFTPGRLALLVLVGCFPMWPFVSAGLGRHTRDNIDQRNVKRWILYLFYLSLLLSVVSAMFLYPLVLCGGFLAAYSIEKYINNYMGWHTAATHIIMFLGGMQATMQFMAGVAGSFASEITAVTGLIIPPLQQEWWYCLPGGVLGIGVVVSCYLLYRKHLQSGIHILLLAHVSSLAVFIPSVGVHMANAYLSPVAEVCRANPHSRIGGSYSDSAFIYFYQHIDAVPLADSTNTIWLVPVQQAASFAKVVPWYVRKADAGAFAVFCKE